MAKAMGVTARAAATAMEVARTHHLMAVGRRVSVVVATMAALATAAAMAVAMAVVSAAVELTAGLAAIAWQQAPDTTVCVRCAQAPRKPIVAGSTVWDCQFVQQPSHL